MPPRTVKIVEYRAAWQSEFEGIAAELHGVLGSSALRIDHIGSTAVLGLAAKDVIDVQVTVPELNEHIAQALLFAGFSAFSDPVRQDHVPPGFQAHQEDWIKFFFMQQPDTRRCNIHIRQNGKPNQRYALLVRDYLRAETRAAYAYGELKRRLAKSLADPDTYPEVKDPATDLIYVAAEYWARVTGWQLQSPVPRGEP